MIFQDILQFNLIDFLKIKEREGKKVEKLTGNLPYYISLPLIRKILSAHRFLKYAVLMVQKEVGDRLIALPGQKDYSILSLIGRYYARIEKIHIIPSSVFFPSPKVDSMLVKIIFFKESAIIVKDENLFFQVIRASFQQRRKNIKNALKIYFKERINEKQLNQMFQKIGLNSERRGETLHLEEFVLISNNLKDQIRDR
jgi:16S rRNA (adenine1518-N6/adenine1519-N6)-dimethyltransferase